MTFPDFIPLEFRGMSILTATFFFFAGLGACYMHTIIRREFSYIYNTLDDHEGKLDGFHDTLNDMKTNIALLLQSVQRIEETIKKR